MHAIKMFRNKEIVKKLYYIVFYVDVDRGYRTPSDMFIILLPHLVNLMKLHNIFGHTESFSSRIYVKVSNSKYFKNIQ